MRKLLVALFALVPILASAQYGPPGYPNGNSTVGFQPLAKTSAVAGSTTSASVAIGNATGSLMTQVQVYNGSSTGAAFVVFCAATPCTASAGSAGTQTSDYPIAPGAVIVLTVPAGTTIGAVVLSSGTGTVYFTPGVGL